MLQGVANIKNKKIIRENDFTFTLCHCRLRLFIYLFFFWYCNRGTNAIFGTTIELVI